MFPGGYNMPFNSYNAPIMGTGFNSIPRSGGLFSRLLGARIGSRSFSWGSLLNNASKTLSVINQAVPLVKQVGPIYNNMKSMLKIASLFKDETEPVSKSNNINNSVNNISNTDEQKENTIINNNYSNSPNFFI